MSVRSSHLEHLMPDISCRHRVCAAWLHRAGCPSGLQLRLVNLSISAKTTFSSVPKRWLIESVEQTSSGVSGVSGVGGPRRMYERSRSLKGTQRRGPSKCRRIAVEAVRYYQGRTQNHHDGRGDNQVAKL